MGAVSTRPWIDPSATWAGIVDTIEQQVLPQVQQRGANFLVTLCTTPRKMRQEVVEYTPHRFPLSIKVVIARLGVLLHGEGWIAVGGTVARAEGPTSYWFPSNAPSILHGSLEATIPLSEWLVCDLTQFGVLIVRCRVTPKAHYEGPLHVLLDPELPALLLESLWGEQPLTKRRLMAFWSLLARARPALPTFLEWLPRHFAEIPTYLQQALQQLHHAYMHPIRLRDIARWSYTNPSHLCRLFHRWIGMSPLAYLTRLRMGAAWQLLVETSLPISIVAWMVGYRNLRCFLRHFEKNFGLKPSQTRTTISPLYHRLFGVPPYLEAWRG